nr:hypothetical protein [Tanacetum cinerariifolium]
MFDEYLDPLRADRMGFPAQAAQPLVFLAGTPLSTNIDQDAPSPHISPSSLASQSHCLPLSVVAEPHLMEDHNVAPGISAQPNHHTFRNHFIISTDGAKITHSIMSLAIPLDRYL